MTVLECDFWDGECSRSHWDEWVKYHAGQVLKRCAVQCDTMSATWRDLAATGPRSARSYQGGKADGAELCAIGIRKMTDDYVKEGTMTGIADAFVTIAGEVEYAESIWEGLPREERPHKDEDKSVEFWLMHMRRYLRQAEEGCYGTDKTPALEAIRKMAALATRCMMYHDTPKREA